jgi:hypothetical protein
MAEIVLWHLGQDGRPPLRVVNDKLVPCEGNATGTLTEDPDKIVICSEFPKGFPQITKVRLMYSISDTLCSRLRLLHRFLS